MKRILIILLVILIFLLTFTGCSTIYMKESFIDFSNSTKTIGKNTTYCFEQLFDEEINTRIAESINKDAMTQSELEPKVLDWSQLELRKKLMDYITNYVKLLESVVIIDYQKDISKNAKQVQDNLNYISTNHDFIDKKEIAVLSSFSTGLVESLTSSARRSFLIKVMNQHQPILELAVQKLISELQTTQLMINNFFDRQFLFQVALVWPEKETSREKYAKIGVKILERKREINSMLEEVIKALDFIPFTHKDMIRLLKYNDSPITTLDQLSNFGARLEEMYVEIAKKKK
jgi:hypothetical protein